MKIENGKPIVPERKKNRGLGETVIEILILGLSNDGNKI